MLELHWGLNSDIILEKSVDYTKKALETKHQVLFECNLV